MREFLGRNDFSSKAIKLEEKVEKINFNGPQQIYFLPFLQYTASDLLWKTSHMGEYGKGRILHRFLALFSAMQISKFLSKFFLRSIGILR